MRYGRCDETDESNSDTVFYYYAVWLEIRFSRVVRNGVRTKYGKFAPTDESVESLVARFYVVVADDTYVVSDEVTHVGHFVLVWLRVDIVEVVCRRFALQNIAAVDKYQVLLVFFSANGFHVCIDLLQSPFSPFLMSEIVGKVVPVNVACENDFYVFVCCHLCRFGCIRARPLLPSSALPCSSDREKLPFMQRYIYFFSLYVSRGTLFAVYK